MAVGTKSASATMPTILKDSPQSDDLSLDSTAATDPVVHGGGDHEDNVVDEALDFVRSLPPGFRFCPHDEELVVSYLRKRVNDEPLPHDLIKEVELYKYDPEHLAEKYREYGEKEWYFFTPRDRKYQNGGRPKRSAGNGYWKATGADKPIKVEGKTVGFRKALVFYHGKPPKGEKTNWIMHEYRLDNPPPRPPPKAHPDAPRSMMLDKCVLCRIYKKDDKPLARSTRQRDGVGTCVGTTSMEDIDCDDDGFVMDSNEVSPVIYPNSTNIISPNSGTTMDVQIPYMNYSNLTGTPQLSPELIMPPYNYQEFYQPPKPIFLGSNHQNQYVQPVSSFVGHMMPRSRFMPTTEPQPQRFFMSTELAAPPQPSPPYADEWYQMAETTAGTEFLYDHSDYHQVNGSFYVNPFMYQKDYMKPSPK